MKLRSLRPWGAALAALAVVAGSVSAAGPAQSAAAPERSLVQSDSPGPLAAKKPSWVVPVLVTLGGEAYLRGARVEMISRTGKVLQSAKSSSKGLVIFDRAKVSGAVQVRAIGGRSVKGIRNNAVLQAPFALHPTRIELTYVSPVSTTALRVAKLADTSYKRALADVLEHVGLRRDTRPAVFSHASRMFHHARFAAFARSLGGVRQAVGALAKEVISGAPERSFEGPRAVSARSLTSWAGQMIITSVTEAATGESPEGVIGNMFGVSDPTSSALSSIESDLTDIKNELATVESEMQDMLDAIQTSSYYDAADELDAINSNVSSDWELYQTTVDKDQLDDTALLSEYASQFIADLSTGTASINEYESLFTNGATPGVLAELYTMNLENPWWDASDVSGIQSTVDYYGTYQAQAAALLSEAWTFQGKDLNYISDNTGLYEQVNEGIYDSMPTSVSTGEVVDPQAQVIYKLAPKSTSGVAASYSNEQQDHPSTCSSLGTSYTYSGLTVVPTSTVEGWWTSAAPSGWKVSTTSAFTVLKSTRALNGVTQNALLTLASGDTGAWAVVTADSVPYGAGWYEPIIEDGHNTGRYTYSFSGYLWCGGTTVTLVGVEGKPTQWTDDFLVSTGSYVPTGVSVSTSTSMPMGVLVQQAGHFAYVQPTDLG